MINPRAILVLRFSSIGDIVLATSPLTTLRNRFPEARIDFMILSHFAPLLENHPFIDRIIKINKTLPISSLKWMGKLANDDYDLVIDLHNSLRSKLIRKSLSEPSTLVYKKPRWKRFKLIQLHINDFDADFNQRKLYHECLKPIMNGSSDCPDSFLTVTDNEKKQAHEYLILSGLNNKYMVIIPSAAWGTKCWSVDGYRSVIDNVLEKSDMSVVILGAKNDSICDQIFVKDNRVINLKGKTDLRRSLAIISNARFALGSDTGLTHAAEALGIPTAAILGPTSRETGGGTFLQNSVTIENNDLWCRPCSQNGKQPCFRNEQYCMSSITPDLVSTRIHEMIAKS
ncbi:MAG: glycosyltransferase family 9 protein [Candidatus Marinimicrobia bacterium]|nr:glycosyltransferase family 9 protein [Candidatus Neomarinimicrobiota bacterium]